jgi:hypothetical protein
VGTSVSQPSPDTLNWRAAQATYENSAIPVERVVQEIWRAASGREEETLRAMLSEPIVFHLRDIALSAKSPVEAASRASQAIAESKQTSLVADIASRAAIQAASVSDRALAYSQRVFVEASNYLISRDLPGFVGIGSRNSTVADSVQFKASVLRATSEAVRQVGVPTASTAKAWQKHTAAVLNKLRGRTR